MKKVSEYGKLRIKAYITKRYPHASDTFKELKCKFLEDRANRDLNEE